MTYRLSYNRAYPAGVAKTYDLLLPTPLPELFSQRYLLIPRIREVRDQDGVWSTPGQTRTVVLADRGTMRETLLSTDRPTQFDYRLAPVSGPLKALVRDVHGRWAFESAGTGVRVTWSWDVEPRGRLGTAAEPMLRRLFAGYARHAFDAIEALLLS